MAAHAQPAVTAVAMAVAQPLPGTPVAAAVAQPVGCSSAQQPFAMAVVAQPPMGGLPATVTQPIGVEEPASHDLQPGDKVTVTGGVWKGETCTMVADLGAQCQVDFNGKRFTVSKYMCFDLQGNCIGPEKQAGHSGAAGAMAVAQPPTAVAQHPAGAMAVAQPLTAAGYPNAVVTIAPAWCSSSSSSSSSDDDVFDMVASVEAEANKLYKGFCGKCESCLLGVYKKVLAPCLSAVWICLRAVYDNVLRPCLLAVWTCLCAVWTHPVGKVLLTLGGWLVPNFKNEDGHPDTNKSKCLDDDPDAAYSCIRECGKMPLVGGPTVTCLLPAYLFCKAMIWLCENVVTPCLSAVWRTCLSPCLLAVWRTCLSPCLKALAPCLAWLCCCIRTANMVVKVVDLGSDSSDSD